MNDTNSYESPPDAPVQSANDLFPIRTVARLTGINPITLRAWERRHNLIRPIRTPSGHRLYSTADIELIRRIQTLSEQGMGFSQIGIALKREARLAARIPNDSLHSERSPGDTTHASRPTAPSSQWPPIGERAPRVGPGAPTPDNSLRTRILQAAIALDPVGLRIAEKDALLWFSPGAMIRSLLVSTLRELEQRDPWPDQVLVQTWFSAYIRQRLEWFLSQQPHNTKPNNHPPQIILDSVRADCCMRAREFQLALALTDRYSLRLIPPSLPETLRARLVTRWQAPHWVRLVPSDFTENQSPDTLTADIPRIYRCRLVDDDESFAQNTDGSNVGGTQGCLRFLITQIDGLGSPSFEERGGPPDFA